MIDDEGMMILCAIAGLLMLGMALLLATPLLVMGIGIAYLHKRTNKGWLRRGLLVLIIAGGATGQWGWIKGIQAYDSYITQETTQ